MTKKVTVLCALIMAAGLLSQEAAPVPVASGPLTLSSVPTRLANAAVSGVAVVLSPLGVMAGCGGGDGPSSATAVALRESRVAVGAGDGPVSISSGASGVSHLAVADRRPITGVSVDVRLANPSAGRVRLSLRSPGGDEVVLFDGDAPGLATSFDSSTHGDLRALSSRSPEGVWSLTATAPDGATLESWSLTLRVRD
jgi:hypothetical protein